MDFVGEILGWSGWDWVTLGAVVLGLIGALLFVVRLQVAAGWDWWGNPFGRFLMTRKLLLAALFGVVLTNRAAGDWPAREAVTALLMVAFAVQTFVPYRLLMKVQEEAHQKKEASRS